MTESARRTMIRALVVMILGYYAVQTVLVAKIDEPYPGLMMPRFSWAGPQQVDGFDTKEADAVFAYADGSSRTTPLSEVLAAVPGGHRYTMMENLFTPLDPATPIARGPWGKVVPPLWLVPGYGLGKGSHGQPEHERLLAGWLEKRARTLYGAAKPTSCSVIWYQAKYRADERGEPIRASRVVSGRFEVALN